MNFIMFIFFILDLKNSDKTIKNGLSKTNKKGEAYFSQFHNNF